MSERGRALIVYETMFGNTERIARAIRDGLRRYVAADTVPVNRPPAIALSVSALCANCVGCWT